VVYWAVKLMLLLVQTPARDDSCSQQTAAGQDSRLFAVTVAAVVLFVLLVTAQLYCSAHQQPAADDKDKQRLLGFATQLLNVPVALLVSSVTSGQAQSP